MKNIKTLLNLLQPNFNRFLLFDNSSFVARLSTFVQRLGVVALRNGGRQLISTFLEMMRLIGIPLNLSLVKVVCSFLFFCARFVRKGSIKQLVLYLKVSTICLQKFIANEPIKDLTPLGIRVSLTGKGLPRIIPALHRVRIMRGEHKIVRLWLTLFAILRVLVFDGKFTLRTITNPGVAFNISPMVDFVPLFFFRLKQLSDKINLSKWSNSLQPTPFIISKSTPTLVDKTNYEDRTVRLTSTSMLSILATIELMKVKNFNFVKEWLSEIGDYYLESLFEDLDQYWEALSPFVTKSSDLNKTNLILGDLGKLGFKQEAAGKLRVFAMVDPLTQWVLEPLHKLIFGVLARIPTDGTFDQLKPLKALIELADVKHLPLYSFDLSSATDRLPVSIQVELLKFLLGEKLALLWKSILVDRDYSYDYKSWRGVVRYAVGQPMGALSSWAMLALTHHFLVQYAALKAGHNNWFKLYAVLGDDLVIADREVANQYLNICDEIGLGVNLHKSLSSPDGTALEFAKRTFWNKMDVTPATLKSNLLAKSNIPSSIDLINTYNLSLKDFLLWSGFGYKAVSLMNLDLNTLYKSNHKRLADRIFLYTQNKQLLAGKSIAETLLIRSAHTNYNSDLLSRVNGWLGIWDPVLIKVNTSKEVVLGLSPVAILRAKCLKWLEEFNREIKPWRIDLPAAEMNMSPHFTLALSQELGLNNIHTWEGIGESDLNEMISNALTDRIESDSQIVTDIVSKIDNTPIAEMTIEYYLELNECFGQVLNLRKLYKAPNDILQKSYPAFSLRARIFIQRYIDETSN